MRQSPIPWRASNTIVRRITLQTTLPSTSKPWSPRNRIPWDSRSCVPCKGVVSYVLFVIELKTRRVSIAGITRNPDARFMAQGARTHGSGRISRGKRILLHDRDTKFTQEFVEILGDSGVGCKKLPVRSPNLNAYAERFVLSIKTECLNRDLLRRAVVATGWQSTSHAITRSETTRGSATICSNR